MGLYSSVNNTTELRSCSSPYVPTGSHNLPESSAQRHMSGEPAARSRPTSSHPEESPFATSVPATNDQEEFDRFFIDQQENITVNPDRYGPLESMDDLDPMLVANLRQMGYRRLLPLQAYSTNILLSDRHLLVRAPTGSGKTAAFLIPAVQYVIRHHSTMERRTNYPLILILGNTNNLMEQTFKFACTMAGYEPERRIARTNVRILDLYSGGYGMRLLRSPSAIEHEIVVATCGGVLKALDMNKLDLSHLKLLVIDEADKMTDTSRGFGLDVQTIYSKIPEETRLELMVAEFSATFFDEDNTVQLSELEKDLFNGEIPTFIDVPAPRGYITQRVIQKGERINQIPGWRPNFDKDLSWLVGLIEGDLRLHGMNKEGPFRKSTVIFVERKITANYLAVFFQLLGYRMEPMNSDFTPEQNREVLRKMMNGEIQGVVATNKLSRGQDIPEVDHVIIYEMSSNFDDYKHRIGRTGRLGKGGRSTVLFSVLHDHAHIVPLFDFMCFHNQIIPEWLYREYTRIKGAEQLRSVSSMDSFVSAGSNVTPEPDVSDDELVRIENTHTFSE